MRSPSDVLDFSRRAEEPEWMDQPCSYEEFRACLRDIAASNKLTFNYRPTLTWLNRMKAPMRKLGRTIHILDVGCASGDMLRRIQKWAGSSSVPVRLTGIDLNPYSARAARESGPQNESIEWITGDAFSYPESEPVDIVISSLFTHHLTNAEAVHFLRWMERRCELGWFISDLHRQPGPYHLFKLLSKAARWHRFVQHDGPLSIRRSFDFDDWRRLCAEAGIEHARIETFRPARLCVGRVKAAAG